MTQYSGMLLVKKQVSDMIQKHVNEFLEKGGKIDALPGVVIDTNYRPARESFYDIVRN